MLLLTQLFFVVPDLGNKNHQYHNQREQSTYGNTFESKRQTFQKNENLVQTSDVVNCPPYKFKLLFFKVVAIYYHCQL